MKSTNSTTTTKNTQPDLVESILEVGGDWARQGIDLGINAVRTQAGLFETLSKTLTKAADALAAAAKPETADAKAAPKDDVVDTTATTAEAAPAPVRKRRAGPAAQA